jgi:RES domain-containing protein
MTHRRLDDPMKVYRIGDPRGTFPVYSGQGARLAVGRWHRKGQGPIYTSEHLSLSILEKLVHYSGELPAGQCFIEITIPAGVSYEVVEPNTLPGWHRASCTISRKFGSKWLTDRRSAILIVPSVVVRHERNVLINPAHPDFERIKPGLETPLHWDDRLFSP